MRYIYPFVYPYAELVAENARRGRKDPEAELWDIYGPARWEAGEFWDITVEYGKSTQDEILCRVRATNSSSTHQVRGRERGSGETSVHLHYAFGVGSGSHHSHFPQLVCTPTH